MDTKRTTSSPRKADLRLRVAERTQWEWTGFCLDEMVRADDPVRVVWDFVQRFNLDCFYKNAKAVEGNAGRDLTDVRILVTLWIMATLEGITSARELERATKRDIIYRWICGKVTINHHTLSDFRVEHEEAVHQLLTDMIAALLQQGVVKLETTAQDGMRVRANAGSDTFKRKPKLEDYQRLAAEQVRKFKRDDKDDESDDNHSEPPSSSGKSRQQAAKERAARERLARVDEAMQQVEELAKLKEARKKGSGSEARVSTTDSDARKMKMGDGGFRPAFNVQFATDTETRLIVAVGVTNLGSDTGLMPPMLDQIKETYKMSPKKHLVDGGFVSKPAITKVEQQGIEVYSPIHKSLLPKKGKTEVDLKERLKTDNDETYAQRQRMLTEAGKELYKLRSSTAEFANAGCRNHGLYQFKTRGLKKVKTETLWYAITHNFLRILDIELLPKLNLVSQLM